MMREGSVTRQTAETDIRLSCRLEGIGEASIRTPVGFLNHMLALLARHGGLGLKIEAAGDTVVDDHHLTEDIGICLGEALRQALGDKAGINRYGAALIPMDEALAQVVIDLSGRPYLVWNVMLPAAKVGSFDTELAEEFMRALANHAGLTLHINVPYGKNTHHILEAVFKGLGHALRQAVRQEGQSSEVLSTKGIL